MSELILSSDTINEGRIKINNAYSAVTNLWSASTGSNSIIADNSTENLVESTYSSILGGTGHLISGSTQYSAIVGGQNNKINPPSSFVDFGSAIVGGENTVMSGLSYSVSLGGELITSSLGDRSTMIQGLKTTKARVRNSRVVPTILGYNTTGQDENILSDDDIIFVEINVPGATPAPGSTDFALDIGSFLNSKSGRTVEMRITGFNGGRLYVGAVGGGKGSSGFQINDEATNDSFWVQASNTLSYVNILNGGKTALGATQVYIYGIV